MKKIDGELSAADIDASLTYGQVFTSKAWRNTIIVCIVLFAVGIFAYIAYVVVSVMENSMETEMIIYPCCAVCLITVALAILGGRGIKDKRKATSWLQDAVILPAKAKSLGETLAMSNMITRVAVALEVKFSYNGERYMRQSTHNDELLYLAVYKKYANQEITIAYSPKYDEVMLIKPKSAQRLKDSQHNKK